MELIATQQPEPVTDATYKPRPVRDAIFEAADLTDLTIRERVALRIAARHEAFLEEAVKQLIAEGSLPVGSNLSTLISSAAGWLLLLQILAEILPELIALLRKGNLQLRR